MKSFYVIEPAEGIIFGTKWAYAEIIKPSQDDDPDICPVCQEPVTLLKWIPPLNIKLSRSHPNGWGDFLWGGGFYLMVSDRFKEIYEKEGLTGIKEFQGPANIIKFGTKKPEQISVTKPLYYQIQVPWGGANQDDVLSNVRYGLPENVTCSYCREGVSHRLQDSIVIEEGSWNGSDIFMPRGAPVILMFSEKFREIAEKYKLTNILLVPGDSYCYDEREPLKWMEMIDFEGKGIWKSK